VLWLLILGAFINVIIAWIYDITPGGMRRTKPMEEVTPEERIPDSRGWKAATYISLVVIVGLIVLNIVGGGKQVRAGDIQSLVILPFENFTGDDQLDNMIYSMHSLLIGDIGRISGLRVIGKMTSKIYKDTDMSAKNIARECNVDAVMESTIMSLGDSVCMQFRLVNTSGEEDQIWSGDYCEDKRQILNLYNRITKKIAQEVKVQLTPEEERLLAKSRTVDREAYDAYLKGSFLIDDGSEESLYKALEYLNSAIEKDPDWAPLYSGLTLVWWAIAGMGYETPEIAGPKIIAYRNKALELDPDLADIHRVDAFMAHQNEWNWEKSEKLFLKAIALNPNDAQSRVLYGQLLCNLQRPGEALTQGQLAIELDPGDPLVQVWYSVILNGLGDCEAALTYMEKLVATNPGHLLANIVIEMAAFQCKDYEKAFRAAKHILPLEEDALKEIEAIFEKQGFVAAYEEITNQMEVVAQNGRISQVAMAARYIYADRPDKAMDWLEKGFEEHYETMPFIATGRNFEQLYDNPRFIEILQKMNLPLPED